MGDGDERGRPDENSDSDDAGSPADDADVPGSDESSRPEEPAPDDDADAESDGSAGSDESADARESDADSEPDGTEETDTEAADDGAAGDAAESEPDETETDDDAEGEPDSDEDEDADEESEDTSEPDGGAPAGIETPGTITETEPDHGLAEPDDSGRGDGPREDEELPLTAHIEELLQRALVVMIAVTVVSVAVFPFGENIINLLWESALPGVEARPRLYSPLELVITQIKVASLAGVIVALPVLVYQSYRFMRPGLYPHERRYYLAAVPTSLVLAFFGLVFGYFVVLPTIFTYFHSYSEDVADIAFALGRTFDLILVLLGTLAIVFQIPLFIMLAMMMGLVTREWLVGRRLIFWGSFLGISMLFSPDPTGMAPFLLTATMIALFEGTLLLAKWVERGRERLARR